MNSTAAATNPPCSRRILHLLQCVTCFNRFLPILQILLDPRRYSNRSWQHCLSHFQLALAHRCCCCRLIDDCRFLLNLAAYPSIRNCIFVVCLSSSCKNCQDEPSRLAIEAIITISPCNLIDL